MLTKVVPDFARIMHIQMSRCSMAWRVYLMLPTLNPSRP